MKVLSAGAVCAVVVLIVANAGIHRLFRPSVMILGDSITFGQSPDKASPAGGYVTLLNDERPGQCLAPIVNEGHCGATSRDILSYAAASIQRWRPLTICVAIGTNDVRTAPVLVDELNYVAMVERLRMIAPNARIVLSTIPIPQDDALRPNAEKLNAWLRGYASRRGLSLCDIAADAGLTSDDYWKTDGLHPMLSGYRKIARCWERMGL